MKRMDPDLLLLPACPGLLSRGAPVRYGDDGREALALEPGSEVVPLVIKYTYQWRIEGVFRGDVSLDLSLRAGRNRAAEWLAGQWGLPLGSTGPSWCALRAGGPGWLLAGETRDLDAPIDAYMRRWFPAPGTIDPADPRLLPDGSRWVDARALILACLEAAS